MPKKKTHPNMQLDFNEHLLTVQNCQTSETPRTLEDSVKNEGESEKYICLVHKSCITNTYVFFRMFLFVWRMEGDRCLLDLLMGKNL